LGVGSFEEGNTANSVGNSQVLKETALIEAFNLKAAIEYQMKNIPAAKEAIIDMPPRNEDVNFLLNNPPFPPETFSNLLLL